MNRIHFVIFALVAVALLSHRPTRAQEQLDQKDKSAIANAQETNSSDAPAIETKASSAIQDLDDTFAEAVKKWQQHNLVLSDLPEDLQQLFHQIRPDTARNLTLPNSGVQFIDLVLARENLNERMLRGSYLLRGDYDTIVAKYQSAADLKLSDRRLKLQECSDELTTMIDSATSDPRVYYFQAGLLTQQPSKAMIDALKKGFEDTDSYKAMKIAEREEFLQQKAGMRSQQRLKLAGQTLKKGLELEDSYAAMNIVDRDQFLQRQFPKIMQNRTSLRVLILSKNRKAFEDEMSYLKSPRNQDGDWARRRDVNAAKRILLTDSLMLMASCGLTGDVAKLVRTELESGLRELNKNQDNLAEIAVPESMAHLALDAVLEQPIPTSVSSLGPQPSGTAESLKQDPVALQQRLEWMFRIAIMHPKWFPGWAELIEKDKNKDPRMWHEKPKIEFLRDSFEK